MKHVQVRYKVYVENKLRLLRSIYSQLIGYLNILSLMSGNVLMPIFCMYSFISQRICVHVIF